MLEALTLRQSTVSCDQSTGDKGLQSVCDDSNCQIEVQGE